MISIIAALVLGTTSLSFAQEADEATAAAATVKAQSQKPGAPSKKSGLSTDLFEREEGDKAAAAEAKEKTFSAKVKVVREESDGVEIFFEGDKNTGTFFLHRAIPRYATLLKYIEESKKPQGPPISVTVDEDKKIKKIEKPSKQDAVRQMPTDPNQKWDFSPVGN
jgi:hypothetical protein